MNIVIAHIDVSCFEKLYIQLREKEGRIYTDEELLLLPAISPSHLHFKEWQIRRKSCAHLINYLSAKKISLDILEIGCGNGWLSAKLSAIPSATVTGVDVNGCELEQAVRVFKQQKNLYFRYENILESTCDDQQFDIIVFAASIQYFPSLQKIIKKALSLLRLNGEIHIIDSSFYKNTEVCQARLRSREYFEKMSMPEMAKHYFHHGFNELNQFDYKILHNPNFITHFILKIKNPFYWICLRN